MTRKILGIVSSYNTMCGNATYTHVLKEEFAKHCDVKIITVNHRLLATVHPLAAVAIEEHIQQICREIKSCDYVNIQFEPGLYGSRPRDISSNICRMIEASKQLVFTVHRLLMPPDGELHIGLLKSLMGGVTAMLGTGREWRYKNANYSMMKKIVAALANKNQALPNSVVAITHTQRDRENLELYYGLKCVVDFPVTFLNQAQIHSHVQERAKIRAEVLAQYNLNPAHKHIGIFGFLSENKGHHIALEALRYLPKDYRLAVFGGQHPMSLREYSLSGPSAFTSNNSPYIASLVDAAKELVVDDEAEKVMADETIVTNSTGTKTAAKTKTISTAAVPAEQRVRFLGTVNDPDFIRAIIAMDYVFVPYFETGQGGSGNASLILELQSKAVFARNIAFLELSKYYKGCYKFADIGNPVEMAQTVFFWQDDFTANQAHCTSIYNIENNVRLHLAALEGGLMAAQELKQNLGKAPPQIGVAAA